MDIGSHFHQVCLVSINIKFRNYFSMAAKAVAYLSCTNSLTFPMSLDSGQSFGVFPFFVCCLFKCRGNEIRIMTGCNVEEIALYLQKVKDFLPCNIYSIQYRHILFFRNVLFCFF